MVKIITYFRETPFATFLLMLIVMHAGWIKFAFPEQIYMIDVFQRIVVILVLWVTVLKSPRVPWRQIIEVCISPRHLAFILISVCGLILLETFVSEIVMISRLNQYLNYGRYPEYVGGLARLFDLTVGIFLVAVAEELVYRQLFLSAFKQIKNRVVLLYLGSAIIFAEIHIVQGWDVAIPAFFSGLVLMYAYRKMGTLIVPICIHMLFNQYLLLYGIPDIFSV